MTKKPDLFAKIRTRITRTGKQAKFATLGLGADLSTLVPAPKSLLERLGIRKAYVPAGVRATVRSFLVTAAMLGKARLEAEEGRTLSRPEAARIRGGKRFTAARLGQKLRFDPRLDDRSLYPSYWNPTESFQWNWQRDQRRFLQLAQDRTGIRYEVTKTGEWIRTTIAGARREVMSDDDWQFYTSHLHANYDYYAQIAGELLELPPGEVSPQPKKPPREGRANQSGRSQYSYKAPRRKAA